MAPATATLEPATALGFHELPIVAIDTGDNPRRRFDEAADADLADSVRQHGILEPLIVRPHPTDAVRWQIVAGERRFRAGQAAGLVTVPAIVRQLTDAQALEVAVIENDQRKDVHPLDEAHAFKSLLNLGAYTPVSLAAKLGRPTRYVVNRLKLLMLEKSVCQAFDADRIALGHAEKLATLTPEQQRDGLQACFEVQFDYTDNERHEVLRPVHELQDWINDHIRLDLAHPETQEEFPELVADVAQAQAAGATVLMLSDAWYRSGKTAAGDPLLRSQWEESKAKDAVLGVIVEGRRRGKTLMVKLKAAPARQTSSTAKAAPKTAAEKEAARQTRETEQKRRAEEEAKAARAQQVRTRVLNGLVLPITDARWNSAPVLRLLADVMVGTDSFDEDDLAHAASALGVSREVFRFSGAKARRKLSVAKLRSVVAILAVGFEFAAGDFEAACDVFGISARALDKAVAKEQAAAKSAAGKPAKKR